MSSIYKLIWSIQKPWIQSALTSFLLPTIAPRRHLDQLMHPSGRSYSRGQICLRYHIWRKLLLQRFRPAPAWNLIRYSKSLHRLQNRRQVRCIKDTNPHQVSDDSHRTKVQYCHADDKWPQADSRNRSRLAVWKGCLEVWTYKSCAAVDSEIMARVRSDKIADHCESEGLVVLDHFTCVPAFMHWRKNSEQAFDVRLRARWRQYAFPMKTMHLWLRKARALLPWATQCSLFDLTNFLNEISEVCNQIFLFTHKVYSPNGRTFININVTPFRFFSSPAEIKEVRYMNDTLSLLVSVDNQYHFPALQAAQVNEKHSP